MATLPPETRDYLRELAGKLDTAGHGKKGELVRDAAQFLGWSAQTVYRQLKDSAGWDAQRATRSDKGSTLVDQDVLLMLGAVEREAIRENNKQTLFTTTARGMLESNGIQFNCSTKHLNRLLRDRKLNVAAQRNANPVQALRAPHPNHTHEIDPSLCLIYYLRGRQYLIRDDEFYKNKLDKVAAIKYKVYRYVLYDRASGVVIPWYVEAAGENQHNLFDFLMFAWGVIEGRLFSGPPLFLLWDKGSANISGAIANLLKHLDVTALTHEAGKARVKGGVEQANNLVETQFESRLRFEPVSDIAALNKAAFAWANAWNANLMPGQDTRLHRIGLAEPIARYDLWQLITAAQLRVLPDVDVCRALMAGKIEQRTVRPDMAIQYRHLAASRPALYSLRGLAGICVNDVVTVRPLVYGDCAIQVEVARYDGEALIYRVEPERDYDRFGQSLQAAVVGTEYKSQPHTAIEQAAADMDQRAYPDRRAEEIKRARARKATPFEGLNAHGYLQDVDMPTYLQRDGQPIQTPAHISTDAPRLSNVAAMLRIVDALGRNLTSAENTFLSARYADGVPENQIAALIEQFAQSAPDQSTRVA